MTGSALAANVVAQHRGPRRPQGLRQTRRRPGASFSVTRTCDGHAGHSAEFLGLVGDLQLNGELPADRAHAISRE
jgi:hypothetical protein